MRKLFLLLFASTIAFANLPDLTKSSLGLRLEEAMEESELRLKELSHTIVDLRQQAISQKREIEAAKAVGRTDLPELESNYRAILSDLQNLRLEMMEVKSEAEIIAETYQKMGVPAEPQSMTIEIETAAPSLPKVSHKHRPEIEKRAGFAGVEFLWWTVEVGATHYVVKGQVPSINLAGNVSSNQTIGAVGDFKNASFDWGPGLRAFVGYRFPRDFWELQGLYTYYHSSGSDTVNPPEGFETLIGSTPSSSLAGLFRGPTTMQKATSHTHFNYNVADLILGRTFALTRYIRTRPYMSLTGAWLWQDWAWKNIPTDLVTENTIDGEENWKFSGGGLRFGFDWNWLFSHGFSLDSKGSVAGYLGHYHHHSSAFNNGLGTLGGGEPEPPKYEKNILFNDTRLVYHASFALMPSWGRMYEEWGFLFYLGYELNLWFNLHEVYRSVEASTNSTSPHMVGLDKGLVGLHGLTTGVKFTF